MPATSQLDKLISITAISVLSCFRTIRDWFRSFGFCIGTSIGHISDDGCNFLAAAKHLEKDDVEADLTTSQRKLPLLGKGAISTSSSTGVVATARTQRELRQHGRPH